MGVNGIETGIGKEHPEKLLSFSTYYFVFRRQGTNAPYKLTELEINKLS